MIMKETVTVYRFVDAFMQSDTYKNNFSYEGLHALFDYIQQVEDDIGEEFEFDVVGICCDYTEYDDLDDFDRDYSQNGKVYTMDEIREETVVIEIPDTERFIIGVF
tara:strand:+ start:2566 stop:2883 length:318 start_codon:yes stop_codon:yes gene_type:complete